MRIVRFKYKEFLPPARKRLKLPADAVRARGAEGRGKLRPG